MARKKSKSGSGGGEKIEDQKPRVDPRTKKKTRKKR
jgi:hypothetical protein